MSIVYQRVSEKVALHSWSATHARDEVCSTGQGTTEVGVVGRVSAWTSRSLSAASTVVVKGLLLLALLDSGSMGRHTAEGMRI